MTASPVSIIGAGMMTGVDLSTPAACTAIRCAIDNLLETLFVVGVESRRALSFAPRLAFDCWIRLDVNLGLAAPMRQRQTREC